jgi:hypothetical protein
MTTRTWENLILETRYEVGRAAHRNRGSYSGAKLHHVASEYIVGLVDETIIPLHGTLGAKFRVDRKPVLFSCRPCCGCTQGQRAALPVRDATVAQITCTRCQS